MNVVIKKSVTLFSVYSSPYKAWKRPVYRGSILLTGVRVMTNGLMVKPET